MLEFIGVLLRKLHADRVLDLGAQCAFYLIMSFCPFLIFLISVAGFFSISEVQLLAVLNQFMPSPLSGFFVDSFMNLSQYKSTTLLSASLVVALFLSSKGMRVVIRGLTRAYGQNEDYGILNVYGKAMLFTLVGSVTVILLVSGNLALTVFEEKVEFLQRYGDTLRWGLELITLGLTFVLAGLVYLFFPLKRVKLKNIWFGALFAAVCFLGTLKGFNYYAIYFSRYSIYGQIGIFTLFLLWLYLDSLIVLVGGELNASLALWRDLRKR